MSERPDPRQVAEQLLEYFVYAPVGLLYERDEVMERLVARGRSQVQLARLMATMAARRPATGDDVVSDLISQAAGTLAKGISEFGAALGLTPDAGSATESDEHVSEPETTGFGTTPPQPQPDIEVEVDGGAAGEPEPEESASPVGSTGLADAVHALIEEYDQLTARTIIARLDTLSPEERAVIRRYEEANRGRKTILAKLGPAGQ